MKNFLKSIVVFIVCSNSVHALGHGDSFSHSEESTVEVSNDLAAKINEAYLRDVKPIFKKACFDCHSDYTVYPWYSKIPVISSIIEEDIEEAKEHLDFTNDYPFVGHSNPINDLDEIVEEIEAGNMPPLKYKIMHPDSWLSDEEKEAVINWAKKSMELLSE